MTASILRLLFGTILVTMLVATAKAEGPDTAKEMNGYWKLWQYDDSGHSEEDKISKNYTLVIKDGVQETFRNGRSVGRSKFTVSGESYPKRLEYTDEKDQKSVAIITMHSDMYIAYLADPEKRKTELPASFADDAAISTVYSRMPEEDWKKELQQSVTKKLGDYPYYFLNVLPAEQLERDTPFHKDVQIRRVDAGILLVPIKVPVAIDHRIEVVKCTSSDKSVIMPIDVAQGAPGLEGDQHVQSITLLLRVFRGGKATINVDITYNVQKSPAIQYDFNITD